MNDDLAYLSILRRAGVALIVIGVIDVGVMIYCIVYRLRYSSSFNIFAIIAGIFLMRGSLRAAKAISLYGSFMLAALIGIAFAWPVFIPLGLALAALRIYPMRSAASLAYVIAILGVSFWVVRQLRRDAVLAASARSGTRIRSLTGPILGGAAIVLFVTTMTALGVRSDHAKRAEQIAASHVGNGYNLYVTSMRTVRTGRGRTVSAVVFAWNDREIRKVPVNWDEE
jgi:hypothetical protein